MYLYYYNKYLNIKVRFENWRFKIYFYKIIHFFLATNPIPPILSLRRKTKFNFYESKKIVEMREETEATEPLYSSGAITSFQFYIWPCLKTKASTQYNTCTGRTIFPWAYKKIF